MSTVSCGKVNVCPDLTSRLGMDISFFYMLTENPRKKVDAFDSLNAGVASQNHE